MVILLLFKNIKNGKRTLHKTIHDLWKLIGSVTQGIYGLIKYL